MNNKEIQEPNKLDKFLIPLCIALPFNMAILKEDTYGTCTTVTETGECPHAKRKNKSNGRFTCDKNTLTPIEQPLAKPEFA
jgi:hypothetical protein